MNREAARAMKITSADLLEVQVIDEIIPEVTGGAHVDPARQAALIGEVLERQLADLGGLDASELIADRYDRFRRLGRFKVV